MRSCLQKDWPKKLKIFENPFSSVFSELSIVNDDLCKGDKIVVPVVLKAEMLDSIHEGHLGITKSLEHDLVEH